MVFGRVAILFDGLGVGFLEIVLVTGFFEFSGSVVRTGISNC